MTSSAAERILASATLINRTEDLTSGHIDVIQMQPIGINDRESLMYADDALASGDYNNIHLIRMMALWNHFARKAGAK